MSPIPVETMYTALPPRGATSLTALFVAFDVLFRHSCWSVLTISKDFHSLFSPAVAIRTFVPLGSSEVAQAASIATARTGERGTAVMIAASVGVMRGSVGASADDTA